MGSSIKQLEKAVADARDKAHKHAYCGMRNFAYQSLKRQLREAKTKQTKGGEG